MSVIDATLSLDFEPGRRARVRGAGPLELRGPLGRPERYYLRNVTAGVFGGDCYTVKAHCAAGAVVRVESSSATKVFRMPNGEAVQHTVLRAEPESQLTWGPHATILHTGAALRQKTRVILASGARVLLAESLVMGRLAAGECFAFRSFRSALEVVDEAGCLLFREAFALRPGLDLVAAMAGRGALTAVYALGVRGCEPELESLTALTAAHSLAGWSPLPNDCGIVAKCLATSLSEGEAFASCVLALLSQELRQD